jgi:hypothetical protein
MDLHIERKPLSRLPQIYIASADLQQQGRWKAPAKCLKRPI